MGTKKTKPAKPTTKKTRRGSPQRAPKRMPAVQLEVKGAERPAVEVLERLDREFRGHKADQKAAGDAAKESAKRIATELRKLPAEFGGKYRTKTGHLLTVDVQDKVSSKATSKEPRRKKPKPEPTPAPASTKSSLPN